MKKPTGKSPSPQSGAVDQAPLGPSGSATLDEPQSIAGVIGVVPGEVSPEEKARARQMLNALEQIRERSPRPSRQGISPPPQEHSAAASGEFIQSVRNSTISSRRPWPRSATRRSQS